MDAHWFLRPTLRVVADAVVEAALAAPVPQRAEALDCILRVVEGSFESFISASPPPQQLRKALDVCSLLQPPSGGLFRKPDPGAVAEGVPHLA
eukprot:CAMPEP_0196785534 /NCGR_PEP_ID=MMETSP1104-20130614/19538_1 /TAXON_ID=33652 /ORGANISM="Cafeteria sp., Strain Caron Lab Isolate" /LENGTH=92 /DNA_ID=CAMNT_0042155837 /DNA_START=1 /DNA_END=275 /DNA_ORIENTATION=-